MVCNNSATCSTFVFNMFNTESIKKTKKVTTTEYQEISRIATNNSDYNRFWLLLFTRGWGATVALRAQFEPHAARLAQKG